MTRRGVELIQRVVPREALSQIDSICYLIVIAPIYIQQLGYLCVWLKVGDDQGSSLGLRTAVSWDLVFDTEAPPREGGGAWGFVLVAQRCTGAGPGARRLRAAGHATSTWRSCS